MKYILYEEIGLLCYSFNFLDKDNVKKKKKKNIVICIFVNYYM